MAQEKRKHTDKYDQRHEFLCNRSCLEMTDDAQEHELNTPGYVLDRAVLSSHQFASKVDVP